jgi:hypothetical protein
MTFQMKGAATDIGRNYLPGTGADLSDLEGLSAIVVGTDIPFGFMLWYGSEVTKAQSTGALEKSSFYRGKQISVMLPFADGDVKVTHQDGTPYTYAEFQLDPVTSLPAVAGVGVHSCRYHQLQPIQGLGLGHDGNLNYGQKNYDSITVAREGRIFVYAETDMNVDSRVGYRVTLTDPLDEFQCRGGFGDLDDVAKGSQFVAAPKGFRVVKPSKAGGLAVIEIDF